MRWISSVPAWPLGCASSRASKSSMSWISFSNDNRMREAMGFPGSLSFLVLFDRLALEDLHVAELHQSFVEVVGSILAPFGQQAEHEIGEFLGDFGIESDRRSRFLKQMLVQQVL